MLFQVTEINFDFTGCLETWGSYELPEDEQKIVIDNTVGQIWEADDEDDLVEEITCATGWCINSLNYRIVLS